MLKKIAFTLLLSSFVFSADFDHTSIDYSNTMQAYNDLPKEEFAAYAIIKNEAELYRYLRYSFAGLTGAVSAYSFIAEGDNANGQTIGTIYGLTTLALLIPNYYENQLSDIHAHKVSPLQALDKIASQERTARHVGSATIAGLGILTGMLYNDTNPNLGWGLGATYIGIAAFMFFNDGLHERIYNDIDTQKNYVAVVPRIAPQAYNTMSYGLAMAMRF